jgi:hypothetical protein
MDYFILSCGEYINPPRSSELDKLAPGRVLSKEEAGKLDDMNVIKVKLETGERYADIYIRPIYLINDEMKTLFYKYDNSLVFKAVRLIDDSGRQTLYWIMGLDAVECLSDKAEFTPRRTLRHLVLDQDKIGKKPIFTVAGLLEKYIIVRLDVAESLLRREFYGIELKKIAVREEN